MSEIHLRKYGVEATIDFDLFEVDGVDFRVDGVHASGDTKLMKNEGAEANTSNSFTDEGQGYSIVLTATELQAARLVIYVVDQTATKVWLDRKIIIETYGNASAQHAFDLGTASVAQTADHTSAIATTQATLDSLVNALVLTSSTIETVTSQTEFAIPATDDATDNDAYLGAVAVFIDGTDPNQKSFRLITDYVASTRTITVGFAPDFTITTADTLTVLALPQQLMWDIVLSGSTHNVNNSAGKKLRAIAGNVFTDGTAQSGGNNTIQLASGAVTFNDQFRRSRVVIVKGLGVGQENIITKSVASTDTLTVAVAWGINPDVTSDYTITPGQVHTTVRNGGYDNGMVYIDTNSSNSGTERGVDGTSTNPVNNPTDAYVIAVQENLTTFFVVPGSTITLPSDSTGFKFVATGSNIVLNGQIISNVTFDGADSVTGIGTDPSNAPPVFFLCGIGSITLPPCTGFQCGFFGTFTIGSDGGSYTFGGSSDVFDLGLTIDFGSGLNASSFFLASWGGGNVEIQNAGAGTGSYVFSMAGDGNLTVNANCSATTTVTLKGSISRNADVTGITYVETANSIPANNADAAWDEAKSGHAIAGTFGAGVTDIEEDTQDIQSRIPTVLVSGRMDSNMSAINDDATSAANLALSALAIASGAAEAGTLTSTAMTTNLGEATNDQFIDRALIWTSGVLINSVAIIEDYAGATGLLTYTVTKTGESPSATDTFVIL